MKNKIIQRKNGYLNRTPFFQYTLVTLIFPLWGAAASLNDILITQFKSVFILSDFATAFVQTAFYGGYFLIAIPAATVIKHTSYKIAIMSGLLFYIIGCSLFFPASHMATYGTFLAAIFAIAIGLSFLETSCNTFSSMLGPEATANFRLNLSQTFVPLGFILGIVLGKYLIFSESGNLSDKMASMSAPEAREYGEQMLQLTLMPYKYILIILIVVFIILSITRFPKCKAEVSTKQPRPGFVETINYLLHNKHFKRGIVAQFFYVGMQTAVWSFTIRLALEMDQQISDREASDFMIYSYIVWFLGKCAANYLMSRFSATKILYLYSIMGSITLACVVSIPNTGAIYAAIATSFFFGPCWPTIYAHTLDTVKEKRYTETAGAIVVMAIVGGAVIPVIQGYVSDLLGSMQLSFTVSMLCFIIVALYFFLEHRHELQQKDRKVHAVTDHHYNQ
ncbi:L-fucose:H+ symporter permease [Sporolactobacillus sp. THM7-7]|nr:L-fucose:H+ symporter permease [Sporolactobacillus sp. THM7-7]